MFVHARTYCGHLAVFLAAVFALSNGAGDKTLVRSNLPAPSEDFVHGVSLDENEQYFAYWKFDDKSITFEVHVRTRGWVGLGFSPSGGMKGADMGIGWVSDGKAYFKDHHAIGNERPLVDASQDIELLAGHETDQFTVLKFKRSLKNCDDNDFDIEMGTIRLIFAWGDSDPDDHTSILYHGATQRGSKSIVLLDNTKPDRKRMQEIENDKDAWTFDILVNNATVTAERTVYWCRLLHIPKVEQKHHIVKVEPIIEKQNIGLVHHIIIYVCRGDKADEERVGRRCWEGNMPDNATVCDTPIFGWGVGQTAYYFPDGVGMPIGGDESALVQIEMHYDNPMLLPEQIDNSGMRITLTPNLRTHDTGTIFLGHTVSWPKLVVPPGHQSFEVNTYCRKECTEKTIPPGGINIVGVMLHTHLLGEKILLRHVRDGRELPELLREDHYDFNYQQMQILNEYRHVKPGDEFITRCVYNSKKRSNVTFGGSGTDNEMCVAFLMYYPRIRLASCMSSTQDFMPVHQLVMDKAMAGELEINSLSDDYDAYKYLDKLKWTDKLRDEFYQKTVRDVNGMRQICQSRGKGRGAFGGSFYRYMPKVEVSEPWVKPSRCPTTPPETISSSNHVRAFLSNLLLAALVATACNV